MTYKAKAKAKELIKRSQMQGSKGDKTHTSLKWTILAHPQNFQRFSHSYENLLRILSINKK